MSESETEIKRWTAKRKTQVVLDILKGKTTVAEVSRQHDLTPGEIERWVDEGINGMENNFRARPRDIREQYERKLEEEEKGNKPEDPAETSIRGGHGQ